jgi:hypothetical protein
MVLGSVRTRGIVNKGVSGVLPGSEYLQKISLPLESEMAAHRLKHFPLRKRETPPR